MYNVTNEGSLFTGPLLTFRVGRGDSRRDIVVSKNLYFEYSQLARTELLKHPADLSIKLSDQWPVVFDQLNSILHGRENLEMVPGESPKPISAQSMGRMKPAHHIKNNIDLLIYTAALNDILGIHGEDIYRLVATKLKEELAVNENRYKLLGEHIKSTYETHGPGSIEIKNLLAKIAARPLAIHMMAVDAPARGRRVRAVPDFRYQSEMDTLPQFAADTNAYANQIIAGAWSEGGRHDKYSKDLVTRRGFVVYKD